MEDRFEKIKHQIQIEKKAVRELEESYSILEDYIRFSEGKGASIEIIKRDPFSGDDIERFLYRKLFEEMKLLIQ